MSDVSLLLAPRLTADVEPHLTDLAEQRMLSPARHRGYELRLVGATVLPQRQIIARTPAGAWLFVDHVEDPTATQYKGKIPIPADQHARLTELERAGVRPELVWLGQELPASWREGDSIPELVPPPRHLREKDERLTERLRVATRLFLKGALAAPFAVPAVAAVASLDPIVLGEFGTRKCRSSSGCCWRSGNGSSGKVEMAATDLVPSSPDEDRSALSDF